MGQSLFGITQRGMEMARIIDCTMIVSNKLWRSAWRVDIRTRVENTVEIGGLRVKPQNSTIHLNVHCATHVDSPLHRFEHGPTMDEIPIETYFGEAAVVDLTDKGELEPITADDLEKRGKHVKEGDIVLLKTGWTERNAGGNTENMEGLPANWDYWRKGPYPTKSMAEWMVKKKVKAVGYDCPNECSHHRTIEYECTRQGYRKQLEEEDVHRIHLSHGIVHIEYLCNLTAIKKDRVKFFAVPLKLKTEGSPVRAFAIED
jgi:arylformamidase